MDQFEAFLGVNPWTALFVLLNTLTIYFVAKKFLFGPVMKMITDRQKEIDDMYQAAGDAKRFLYGPVMKMIQDRQNEIDDMYAKADAAKTDAAKLRDTYQQQLSQAQSESDRIVKEATLRAQNREEEILRKAAADADAADAAVRKSKLVQVDLVERLADVLRACHFCFLSISL